MVRFSKFLQDNEAKKVRNEKRRDQEEGEIKIKEKELEEANKTLTNIQNEAKAIERSVQAMKRYEEFLEEVRKKHSDEFKDLDEILGRYNTLRTHQIDMSKSKTALEKDMEELKRNMINYKKNSEDKIYELETSISNMRDDLEYKDKTKQDRQKELDDKSEKTINQTSELGMVILSIDHIYNRCKVRQKTKIADGEHSIKDLASDNFEGKCDNAIKQLGEIEACIEDFKKISDEVQNYKKTMMAETMKSK